VRSLPDEKRRTPQNHFNAEGQAALLVGESILMALIEYGVLTKNQLIDVIDTAILTKQQMAEEGQDVEVSRIAAGLLTTLRTSIASLTEA
jgi:hypothetical protein